MAEPIDTGILRAATAVNGTVPRVDLLALCDEVDRLRAENAALAAALGDIAGMDTLGARRCCRRCKANREAVRRLERAS